MKEANQQVNNAGSQEHKEEHDLEKAKDEVKE